MFRFPQNFYGMSGKNIYVQWDLTYLLFIVCVII